MEKERVFVCSLAVSSGFSTSMEAQLFIRPQQEKNASISYWNKIYCASDTRQAQSTARTKNNLQTAVFNTPVLRKENKKKDAISTSFNKNTTKSN